MAINYHYLLRNNPEERSSYLLRGGSLKSCKVLKNIWKGEVGSKKILVDGTDMLSRNVGKVIIVFLTT